MEPVTNDDRLAIEQALNRHAPWLVAPFERLVVALAESVKLQAHYAALLNTWDGGHRIIFVSTQEWLTRLETHPPVAAPIPAGTPSGSSGASGA